MKVLFLGYGYSHYFNKFRNFLNAQDNIQVCNIASIGEDDLLGDGVFQEKEDLQFEVDEIKLIKLSDGYSFEGLTEYLDKKRPDIIVFCPPYANILLYDYSVITKIKELGIKIILRDIPFRMDKYDEAVRKIKQGKLTLTSIHPILRLIIKSLKFDRIISYFLLRKKRLSQLESLKKVYNLFDAHIDYVDEAIDIYESYGVPKEKIFVARNSPDTDYFFQIRAKIEKEPPILPFNNHRLIHVGRLVEWKRVDMLINAFAEIKKKFFDAELLILGYGPQETMLKKLAEDLNINNSVKFIGDAYEGMVLGRLLMASTIYILAGMGGISINDAMCFGLPIICSVCDGTEKRLVKDGYNGLYFKDGDQKDLENKIISMFDNAAMTKEMGESSTNIIRNEINIHTVTDIYIKAFNFVLDQKEKKD